MPFWRLTLRLQGPLGTPLTSGTLFGHLCWAMLRREGEAALERLLTAIDAGEHTLRLSDAVPRDHLPRPLLRPHLPDESLGTAAADEVKQQKKRRWMKRADWLAHRANIDGVRLTPLLAGAAHRLAVVHAHNRIDRYTGTTPKEGGGLWFVEDDWGGEVAERDLYVETDMAPDRLHALLADVGAEGYGRDATYGRGRFTVAAPEPDDDLVRHDGNRLMSLSHGCLDERMAKPRYERVTHFGKVGFALASRTGRPFKRPVLLMRPGATFDAGSGPFGRLLAGVYQDHDGVRHDAQHLVIPFTEAA